MPNALSNTERFHALDALLTTHSSYWQHHAFTQGQPNWAETAPCFSQALLALEDSEVQSLDADPVALQQWLVKWLPELQPLEALLSFAEVALTDPQPEKYGAGIPGRKWQQIQHFTQAIEARESGFVDWCCGKGHLARQLQLRYQQSVRCIEYDAQLIASGEALNAKFQQQHSKFSSQSINFEQRDVLAATAVPIATDEQVVALHACGDLHRELLAQLVEQGGGAVALAPCCYQKTQHSHYLALSSQGKASRLSFTKQDLHTAVQEAVTAGQAVRQRRAQLQAWRLGFDALQRDVRGIDEYLPSPSLAQSALQLGFAGFCQQLAAELAITLPDSMDWQYYQKLGQAQFARAERWDLARKGFRRAIECWLVLDMALWLEQAGYTASIKVFCPRNLTPRNLLLEAWR